MNRLTTTLVNTASRMICRTAIVSATTWHGANFREIELLGDGLKGATWSVGDKVQVRTDRDGFTARTYTPIGWDSVNGSTTLLAYVHGTGPGASWARSIAAGDTCEFFGPRRSLKVDAPPAPVVFVGDETSFALAAAWHVAHPDTPPLAELFEVTDPDDSVVALDALGLTLAELFPRDRHAAHLDQMSATLIGLLQAHDEATLCLTGKAQTIAVLRRELKRAGLAGRSTRVKAYWDENRTGLD